MKNKIRLLLLLIIIILLIPIFISTYYSTPLKIIINNQEYIIYQDTKEINLISYNSNDPINITKKTLFYNTTINDNKLKYDKMISIPHLEINNNNTITLDINYLTGKKRHITINTMPTTFPGITIKGSTNVVGDYYLSTIKDNTIFNYQIIINEQGKIKYYKQTENKTYDFTKQSDNKYTYIENNTLYILDEYFNQYKSVSDVEKYIYLKEDDYIIYYQNKVKRITDNELVWELESNVYSMNLDLDNNLLLVNNQDSIIKKIDINTSKTIWTINNKKQSKKKKITSPLEIIPISNNKYNIILKNKQVTIKMKGKKIKSYKKNNLKKDLTITYKDNNTTIKDKDITIDIKGPISSVSKK